MPYYHIQQAESGIPLEFADIGDVDDNQIVCLSDLEAAAAPFIVCLEQRFIPLCGTQ